MKSELGFLQLHPKEETESWSPQAIIAQTLKTHSQRVRKLTCRHSKDTQKHMARDRELTCNHSAYIEHDVIARQAVNAFTHPTTALIHSHTMNLEIHEGHTERTHTHIYRYASHIVQIHILTICIVSHTHAHFRKTQKTQTS